MFNVCEHLYDDVGHQAGHSLYYGNNNTFIGAKSGYSLGSTLGFNCLVGETAGYSNVAGSGLLFLGSNCGVTVQSVSSPGAAACPFHP